MINESFAVSWFRDEYDELKEKGYAGDSMRLQMYENGFLYLEHRIETNMFWKDKKSVVQEVVGIIKSSQRWIDREEAATSKYEIAAEDIYKLYIYQSDFAYIEHILNSSISWTEQQALIKGVMKMLRFFYERV